MITALRIAQLAIYAAAIIVLYVTSGPGYALTMLSGGICGWIIANTPRP